MPPLDFATVACLGLLLPVPGTLAWPAALTAHLSPGGTRVLRSAGAWGSSRGWLHPDLLCALSEPEFSLLLKETSEREGANEAMEVLKGAVLPPRGYWTMSEDICGCHDGSGEREAAHRPQCQGQPHRE